MTVTEGRSVPTLPPSTVEPGSQGSSGALLPASWPIAVLTVGYPIWWALGLSAIAYPLVALLLIPSLLQLDRLRVPRGFALWGVFVIWVLLSASQLESASRLPSFAYRASVYFAATVLFLWVYNSDRRRLPTERVLSLLVGLWSMVAIGGLIGAIFPRLEFSSLAQLVLPARVFSNPLVFELAHPEFGQVSRILGREMGRPSALFPYTNGWGSAFGILFPVVVAWLLRSRSRGPARTAVVTLLALSLLSVVASLNRGLWLSLALAAIYVTIRLLGQLQLRTVAVSTISILAIVVTIMITPLGDVVGERAESGHSDDGRSSLYEQSIDRGLERPVLGWGSPQPRADKSDGPSVGTHGQAWLVLVSQGIVGLLLYLGWWAAAIKRSWRQPSTSGIWLHATLLVVVLQSFYYEHTPIQLPVAMIVAALLLRPRASATPQEPWVDRASTGGEFAPPDGATRRSNPSEVPHLSLQQR